MAKRYWQNRVVLAKVETVYGTDSAPTGAANAVQATNVELEPLLGDDVSRELVKPYFGNQGNFLTANYARLSYEVEIAGAGTVGTAPKYGPMLRGCGMAEVISAGVDVQYNPISTLQESLTHWFNGDGVKHVLLGARGTFTLDLTPKQIPRFKFTYTGLLGTISDAALPAGIDYSGYIKPVQVNKANTTFSLHGLANACEGFNLDLGNQIEPRFLIGSESIEHVDRQMSGNATLEAVSLATKDWFAIAQAHTTGVLAAQHGTVAGNIVSFGAPAVQIGRPTYGQTQKIINNQLPLILQPVAGNDEFSITVK